MIRSAALAGDKLFFRYLAEYLQKKPKRPPFSEEKIKLLELILHKSDSDSSEAPKELPWLNSKGHYRTEKKRTLALGKLIYQAWHENWSDSLR